MDDCGLSTLSDENRRDLLELLEDRYDRRATIVTSQLPVEHWHEALGDPTLADAILDRLVHNAYKMSWRSLPQMPLGGVKAPQRCEARGVRGLKFLPGSDRYSN